LVGALMVAALALILDGLLALAVWVSVPGTGRLRKPGRRNHVTPTALTDQPAAVDAHVLR
jgi:osmoprotectant transport system permease protein